MHQLFFKISVLSALFLLGLKGHATEAAPIRLTTYNVGLAYTFVPYANERKDLLFAALNQLETDFLCLQEVWTDQDQKDFIQSLKAKYPYSQVAPFNQKLSQKSPVCGPLELFGKGGFGSCLVGNCRSKKGDELTQCVLNTCRTPLDNLKQTNKECATALMSQVGKSAPAAFLTVMNPFKKVGLFAYEGSAGTILLSKWPLENQEILDFPNHSTLNRRAVLYAKSKVREKEIHVACTHLTANLSQSVPYTGGLNTWDEESLHQTQELIKFMDLKAQKAPEVLLGDFNCSLADQEKKIDGDFQESCKKYLEHGYQDPYVLQVPKCTFCNDNSLNKVNGGGEGDLILDHAYIRNFSPKTEAKAQLLFDQLVPVLVEGKTVNANLSDHYGVKIEIQIR